jgi:hypothetical protein
MRRRSGRRWNTLSSADAAEIPIALVPSATKSTTARDDNRFFITSPGLIVVQASCHAFRRGMPCPRLGNGHRLVTEIDVGLLGSDQRDLGDVDA